MTKKQYLRITADIKELHEAGYFDAQTMEQKLLSAEEEFKNPSKKPTFKTTVKFTPKTDIKEEQKEEKPAPKEEQKEEKPPRTPKEVPAGKDPVQHCKDVLTEFRTVQKVQKIKNELIAAAKGDEKKVAEIKKMTQEEILGSAPEKPALSVPEATKEKLSSAIGFNFRQKLAKLKIDKETIRKINEKIPEIVDAFYADLDSVISNTIKNLK